MFNNSIIDNIKVLSNYRRLSHTFRYNTIPVLHSQSVSDHSFHVTILAYTFANEYNNYISFHNSQYHPYDIDNIVDNLNIELVIKLALFHDMEECVTSDIPYHIKHSDSKFEEAISQIIENRINSLFNESNLEEQKELILYKNKSPEYQIVKLADMVECAWFTYDEVQYGNVHMAPLFYRAREILTENFSQYLSGSPTYAYLYDKFYDFSQKLNKLEAPIDIIDIHMDGDISE